MHSKKRVFAIILLLGFNVSISLKAETLRVGFFDLKPHIQLAKQRLLRNPQLNTHKLYGSDLIYRSYQMLRLNRFDAMYSPDQFDFQAEAIAFHFFDQIRILRLPEPPIGLYTAFSKKANPNLIKRYEQSQRQMPSYEHFLKAGNP